MSAFKQSMRKLGVRASVLAGTSAAVLAIAGIGASSALAAPECPSNTVKAIEGKGASLQRVAQEKWTGRFVPSIASGEELPAIPHEVKSGGYAATCGETPSVSYSSTGSGAGLKAFRFTGTGVIENGTHVGENHTISYIGSDDAPTAEQIENAEKATTGGIAEGANPVIIPVAETSIAVPVNLPTGCAIQAEKGITWAELTKIFAGSLKKWSELTWDNGNAACETEITRVVRSDGSGTTYQFKNYLSVIEGKAGAVGPGKVKVGTECLTKTWAQLRPIENAETGALNTTWPESDCNTGVTPVVKQNGGGGVASYVATHSSTIGYAALPDAKGKSAAVARLQNLGGANPTFALPENGTQSNCGTRQYTVPTGGRKVGGTGESVDWSGVFGASPAAGETLYPICALTYDIAWSSYSKAGYTSVTDRVADVKAYLKYVIGEGQSSTGYLESYYQPLPEGEGESTNVKAAAEFAFSKIG